MASHMPPCGVRGLAHRSEYGHNRWGPRCTFPRCTFEMRWSRSGRRGPMSVVAWVVGMAPMTRPRRQQRPSVVT